MNTHDDRLAQKLAELGLNDSIDQIAYLVPDLRAATAQWDLLLGEQDWRTYRYSPSTLPRLGYRGGSGKFAMLLALSNSVPQIELIEPLASPSIYHEWIERRGYGPHHIGHFVEDINAAMDELARHGFEPVQWGAGYGLDGDGGFAYYQLGPDGGTVIELIQPPARRRPSERL